MLEFIHHVSYKDGKRRRTMKPLKPGSDPMSRGECISRARERLASNRFQQLDQLSVAQNVEVLNACCLATGVPKRLIKVGRWSSNRRKRRTDAVANVASFFLLDNAAKPWQRAPMEAPHILSIADDSATIFISLNY